MSEQFSNRRRFLSACSTALIAVISVLIIAPVSAFVTSPLRRRRGASVAGDDFADAGAIDAIPAGAWTLLPIEIVRQDGWAKTRQARSVWVRVSATAPGNVKVLSPICPHLGCPIGLSPDNSQFRCPCHGGTFTRDGTLIGGPPPRGMDALQSQIRDGHLWVRWQDFRISTREQIAVEI